MNRLLLLTLLLLTNAGHYEGYSNQDIRIAVYKCDTLGLRSIGFHNAEGKFSIYCREYK